MFEYAEHNKWISKRIPVVKKYSDTVKELIKDSAARGFDVPPSDTLGKVAEVGETVKLELTNIVGLLYGEQASIMFQIEEFEAKLALEYSKLEMALYIQSLLNALELEQAEMTENYKRDKAYMDKLAADVDKRRCAIIIGKADIESAIIDYKIREVEARALGLDKELELIAAQVLTAQERLKMIQWLNELIVKERAIIEIEQRRAIVLQAIIAIKEEIAAIKEGMIPLYEDKSAAKILQADAITTEVGWKKLLAELGFRKIILKDTEASAEVTINEKKTLLEEYRLALTRASNALTELRSEHDISLTEYSNLISDQVLVIEQDIKETAIDLRLDTSNIRLATDVNNDIALINSSIVNLQREIDSTVDKIIDIARTLKKTESTSDVISHTQTTRTSEITQAISSG
jgi:hypothetical protein